MIRRSLLLAALLAASALAPSARAGLIVGNLAESQDSFDAVNATLFSAQRFTTDGQGYFLTSITAILQAGGPSVSEVARLYTDAGASPGTLIATFDTPTIPTDAATQVTFTPTSPTIVLAANTTYDFVLGAAPGSDNYVWYSTTSASSFGPGSLGGSSASFDGGATYFDNGFNYLIRVDGNVQSVPEPASVTLAGLGLLGVAAAPRRKARKAAATGRS